MNKNINILVTDDLLTMRSLIAKSLNILGFNNISEAEDGKIALEILASNKIDLLITDWAMPNMDGVELTKAVRQHNDLKHIKILMISSKDKPEEIVEAIAAGVDDYVVKPFTAQTLQDSLIKVL